MAGFDFDAFKIDLVKLFLNDSERRGGRGRLESIRTKQSGNFKYV